MNSDKREVQILLFIKQSLEVIPNYKFLLPERWALTGVMVKGPVKSKYGALSTGNYGCFAALLSETVRYLH